MVGLPVRPPLPAPHQDSIDTLGGDRNFANDISDTGFVTGNSRNRQHAADPTSGG